MIKQAFLVIGIIIFDIIYNRQISIKAKTKKYLLEKKIYAWE